MQNISTDKYTEQPVRVATALLAAFNLAAPAASGDKQERQVMQ